MSGWILVASAGMVLAVAGLAVVIRRFRRGEVRGRYVAAMVVGLLSLVGYAVAAGVTPGALSRPWQLALLLPGFVAIVVIVREHERVQGVPR